MDTLKDRRPTRLFWVEDEFFDCGVAAAVGASAALLYLALCRHSDKNGTSFPSIARLAAETGLSERTIPCAIKCLIKHGLVAVSRDRDGHVHQHNVYHLNSAKVAARTNRWELTEAKQIKVAIPPRVVHEMVPAPLQVPVPFHGLLVAKWESMWNGLS